MSLSMQQHRHKLHLKKLKKKLKKTEFLDHSKLHITYLCKIRVAKGWHMHPFKELTIIIVSNNPSKSHTPQYFFWLVLKIHILLHYIHHLFLPQFTSPITASTRTFYNKRVNFPFSGFVRENVLKQRTIKILIHAHMCIQQNKINS